MVDDRDPEELLARHERRVLELERGLRDRGLELLKAQEELARRDERIRAFAERLRAAERRAQQAEAQAHAAPPSEDQIVETALRATREASAARLRPVREALDESERARRSAADKLTEQTRQIAALESALSKSEQITSELTEQVEQLEAAARKSEENRRQQRQSLVAEREHHQTAARELARRCDELETDLAEHAEQLALYRKNLMHTEELLGARSEETAQLNALISELRQQLERGKQGSWDKVAELEEQNRELVDTSEEVRQALQESERQAALDRERLEAQLELVREEVARGEEALAEVEQARQTLLEELQQSRDETGAERTKVHERERTIQQKNEVIYVLEFFGREKDETIARQKQELEEERQEAAARDREQRERHAGVEARLEADREKLAQALEEREGDLRLSDDAIERTRELVVRLGEALALQRRMQAGHALRAARAQARANQRANALVAALEHKDEELKALEARLKALQTRPTSTGGGWRRAAVASLCVLALAAGVATALIIL